MARARQGQLTPGYENTGALMYMWALVRRWPGRGFLWGWCQGLPIRDTGVFFNDVLFKEDH